MNMVSGNKVDGNEVPCLLLPVTENRLLLPTVTVAEMIPYRPPQSKLKQKVPDWFLGELLWRGLTIPMLSFEKISGRQPSPVNQNGQIAIFNNTGVSEQLPFLAISTTGIPHLSRITPEGIQSSQNNHPNNYEIMHVDIDGQQAIIPNVPALERACIELLHL